MTNVPSPQNTVQVIKVGGENASDPRTADWLANNRANGISTAVVISALRTSNNLNTTSELIRAQQLYQTSRIPEALSILDNLFQVHLQTLRDAQMYDNELDDKLRVLFMQYFPHDLEFLESPLDQNREAAMEQRFVGYGEVMSAHVLSHLLDTRFQVANSLVDHYIHEPYNERDLPGILRDEIGRRVYQGLNTGIVIVPGYVSVHGHRLLPLYGRGYTDPMAKHVAVGLSHLGLTTELHIQKQVSLLSSNPQNIDAKSIPQMSYYTAAEITGTRGANAQVLSAHVIGEDLVEQKIPVLVYNPFDPTGGKSIISRDGNPESGILYVDGRDHVNTITVSGFSMSGPGLLSALATIFLEELISIDSISSSETEVTLTSYGSLNETNKTHLSRKIKQALGEEYAVKVNNNLGLIYCIGDNLSNSPGLLGQITTLLGEASIDIECISQSRGQRAITIGVSSANLKKSIQLIHDALITHTS